MDNTIAQSNIGLQLYYFDTTSQKFKYLVPIVGEMPALGAAPSTIDVTEADSPQNQYIPDRPDNPAIELTYNINAGLENFKKVNENLKSNKVGYYMFLLPLKSAFVFPAQGNTWISGGNPIQGTLSMTKTESAVAIGDATKTFTDQEFPTSDLNILKKWLTGATIEESTVMSSLIDLDSVPAGKINSGGMGNNEI